MRTIFAAAMIAGLVGPIQQPTPSLKTELEGTWEGVYLIENGKKTRLNVVYTFEGDKLTIVGDQPFTFSVNTTATPKHLDYWPTRFGPDYKLTPVYELVGDELRITNGVAHVPECGGDNPPRPTTVSGDGPCRMLAVFKRR